tara:strand:+ start:1429 stop:2346 length:918 start_codon:yes stop_codon:yes gene_type:complete
MYPWIDLYFIKIPSFGLMVALAFLVCNFLIKKEFKKNNLDAKIADDIVFYAILSAILGSKIYYIIESGDYLSFFSNLKHIFIKLISLNITGDGGAISELQLLGSGLVFNGGFICALVFIGIYVYRKKLNFLFLFDIVAPFLLLGHGIGRIGCFLVGDDYGLPSDLPWAISFPNGLPPTTVFTFTDINYYKFLGYTKETLQPYLIEGSSNVVSVHPTQLYEMTLYILGFLLLRKFFSNTQKTLGLTTALYLMYAGFSRFIVEIIRTNERYSILELSSAQFISIIIFTIGIAMLLNINKLKVFNGKN